MRHVVVMTASSSIGLLSIFIVDFVDLYFISLLGEQALTAAVGYAGTLLFFTMSVAIGLMISMASLVAQRIGRGDFDHARRIATNVIVVGVSVSIGTSALVWIYAPELLELIGATGEARAHAARYLRIIVPTMPIMVAALSCSGLLRAHGDARRAMTTTLIAGIVNAVLDPVFIFALDLGLDGAAMASVASRFAMLVAAIAPVLRHYGGFAPFELTSFARDLRPIFGIAGPAMLTNVATPIGNLFVTRAIAAYGDAAVAGYAVVGRLTPLAFCLIFALSGAVGPIVGQNFGARDYARVTATIWRALWFASTYTFAIWIVLVLIREWLADAFSITGLGREVIFAFCAVVAPLFVFSASLFVSNSAFNNLNRPVWSAALNWGRHTLGVLPFVWVGGRIAGAPGVLTGQAIGGVVFGVLGIWMALRLARAYADGLQG